MAKNFLNEYKWLFAILLVAFIVRVAYFIYEKPWESNYIKQLEYRGDAKEYQRLAGKILETGTYPENYFLDTYRTPVFPIYVAAIYLIFGIKPHLVFFSHIILHLIIICFLFLLCRKLFLNMAIALIASALYALEPNIIKLVMEFGTETLHATLLIVSVYFFVSGLKENKLFNISVSAIFFGLTALTRPVNLYFYILCIILIVLYPGKILRLKLKTILLFGLFYFISISPWMYRNYKVYDHFSTNAFQGTAVYYNAIIVKSYVTGISMDSVIGEFVSNVDKICQEKNITNPFEMDKEKENYGMNYLKVHPGTYIVLHLKGMVKFFIAPLNNEKYSLKSKVVLSFYFAFIYIFSIIGIIIIIKKKQYYYLFTLVSIIFYFWFITGIIGLSRYRMPTTPFYLILCAIGIYFIFEKLKYKIYSKNI
jgi:4-amino-4-deoxy-L-arabinose transferase-like glycosyltransferase